MELITAEKDGWTWLRETVFRRDGGCVGPSLGAPDGCTGPLEFDHVREKIGGERLDDEAHGITVCAWHHRHSRQWRSDSKVNRSTIREYLRGVYPEVWSRV